MKNLTALLAAFALMGCGGAYTNQAYNQLSTAMSREQAAWAEVQKLDVEQCPRSTPTTPLPKDKALDRYQCYEGLVVAHVMPVAMDANELNKFLLSFKKAALARKQGKIDGDEANLQIQENWIHYTSTLDAKANAALNNAAQQDAQLAQQRQQYFQSLSTQINQTQAQNAMADQSGPTNTNCRVIANQMNCTTW